MFAPDDALAPRGPVFDEPWQAQVLALADALIEGGNFSAKNWAQTLGAALKAADARGAPDSTETYYLCAVEALEKLVSANTSIDMLARIGRKNAWTQAYLSTPHGQPVTLDRMLKN